MTRKPGRVSLPWVVLVVAALAALPLLAACRTEAGTSGDPDQVDSTEVPELGACRMLTPADVAEPDNATETTGCSEAHTAETFAVGPLPDRFEFAEYDDPGLSSFAYDTCSAAFQRFLGADESLVMRSMLSWAWFRPSKAAWADGARWYRCDAIGGGSVSDDYTPLPKTAKGLLARMPDKWLVCANGPTVAGSEKVPCSEPHEWRAVTTIKLGEPGDAYPGDRLVEVRTRDYCNKSVGAWLGYPVNYDYGYTWFHEAEWKAGNRRSICWAKTED